MLSREHDLRGEQFVGSMKNVGVGDWFGHSKTPPWGDRGGALVLGTRMNLSPCLPHPSHDSQLMSRLAIAITIPVTHAVKTENSTRSVRSVGFRDWVPLSPR